MVITAENAPHFSAAEFGAVVREIVQLRTEHAAVLDAWRYDPPYEFYNGEDDRFRRTGEHVRTFDRWGEVSFVEMEER